MPVPDLPVATQNASQDASHQAPQNPYGGKFISGEYRRRRSHDAIAAVVPCRSPPPASPISGRMLDDDLEFQTDDEEALELDAVPSSHRTRVRVPGTSLASKASHGTALHGDVGTPPSARRATPDPRAAVMTFAGFGESPASLWATPGYALRVARRRRTLRASLVVARRRGSPDVALYEAALGAADEAAVYQGFALIAALAIAPVVLVVTILIASLLSR